MFNLTRQERKVALFLIMAAFLGISINFLMKFYSPTKDLACFYEGLGRIDLNLAGKDLLMSVPGIGEKLALRILEYRHRQAGFSSIEELKYIKGVTGYKYEKIRDYLTVK